MRKNFIIAIVSLLFINCFQLSFRHELTHGIPKLRQQDEEKLKSQGYFECSYSPTTHDKRYLLALVGRESVIDSTYSINIKEENFSCEHRRVFIENTLNVQTVLVWTKEDGSTTANLVTHRYLIKISSPAGLNGLPANTLSWAVVYFYPSTAEYLRNVQLARIDR